MILFFIIIAKCQTYDPKEIVANYGTWTRELSATNKISISSYVTRQRILTYANFEQKQKTVSDLPKYRYELVLQSGSLYESRIVKTWLYGAKVYINNMEITREQFPRGFTVLIETTPTVVYWYESSFNTVDMKIVWGNSMYFNQ